MVKSKQIPGDRWVEYCSLLTDGNRGRLMTISDIDERAGLNLLVNEMPLWAVDYDPAEKGDDIVVSMGKDSIEYVHTIDAPVEIWESRNDKGVVVQLRIIDRSSNEFNLTFS